MKAELEARLRREMEVPRGRWRAPSTLFADSPPSARLVAPRAQAAPADTTERRARAAWRRVVASGARRSVLSQEEGFATAPPPGGDAAGRGRGAGGGGVQAAGNQARAGGAGAGEREAGGEGGGGGGGAARSGVQAAGRAQGQARRSSRSNPRLGRLARRGLGYGGLLTRSGRILRGAVWRGPT